MTSGIVPRPRDFADYVYRIRYCVYAVALVLGVSCLLGIATAATNPAETQQTMQQLSSQFSGFRGLSSFDLMISLFLHNALICFLMALLGLAFGAVPLLLLFDNGLLIGMVGSVACERSGLLVTLAAILPHGIIEVPMMALSAAIGLRLGYVVLLSLFRRQTDVAREAWDSARVFTVWVLPLLFAAAFVESYVTTALVYFLAH